MSDEHKDLAQQVAILCEGWSENVEHHCGRVTYPALLIQLRTMTYPLVKAKQEGSSGAGGGTRPPGAFEAAALIDEIWRYASGIRSEWRRHDVLRTTVAGTLLSLPHLAQVPFIGPSDDSVREVAWTLRKFIRQARIIVGHDVATRAFANTVCGECGGELRAPVDAASDVFCAGSPATGPCGTTYSHTDIIRLAVEMEAANGTQDSPN